MCTLLALCHFNSFQDSKVLSAETRTRLLGALESDHSTLGWAVRVVRCDRAALVMNVHLLPRSPQAISRGMLQRPPVNLNVQSQDATVLLIREVLAKGVQLSHVRPSHSNWRG